MWLTVLHAIGLTNLSDEQVAKFRVVRSRLKPHHWDEKDLGAMIMRYGDLITELKDLQYVDHLLATSSVSFERGRRLTELERAKEKMELEIEIAELKMKLARKDGASKRSAYGALSAEERATRKARLELRLERLHWEKKGKIWEITGGKSKKDWTSEEKEEVVQIVKLYDHAIEKVREEVAQLL